MRVRTAQHSGGNSNADRVFVTDGAVIVLDGATAFEPVDVDPGTYADTLGASIVAQLDRTPVVELAHAVAQAITHTAATLHLDGDASPSSTVAILRAGTGSVDLYVLGDSPIYYGASRTVHRFADDRLASLPLIERARYVEALQAGAGYDDHHRATLAELQRSQRRYRNSPEGYWIAEADPIAAGHGLAATLPADRIAWAVLATDGVADLIDHHEQPQWPDVAQLDDDALTGLLGRLHEWESADDPNGLLLPRAKRHDDKTLAAIPAVW